jgi:simple sugar transport system ATP-binding protein
LVGIAGVDGAGQRELLRLLAGRLAASSGTVTAPADVGFIPEDRLRDAIVPGFSLVENMALHGAGARRGWLDWAALGVATRAAINEFSIRADGAASSASNLSGGNQQRFVLAREFANAPRALVAENPTRGLDVRASRDVLQRLRTARDGGAAVVVYSSDIDELLSISDRVLVCYAGAVRELPCDAEQIGRAMVGAS